jgi:ABC-type transport system involved in multi-copper enzyme maturation permease subunit
VTAALQAMRAEWLRLARPRSLVGLVLAALGGAAYAWVLGVAAKNGVFGAPSGFYLVAAASSGSAMACALIGGVFAASSLGGDLANGVARTILCRPVRRDAWVVGRVVASCGAFGVVFIAASLGALGFAAMRYGLHGAYEGDYEIAGASFLARQLAVAISLSLVAQWSALALGAFAGTLFGGSGAAVVAVAVCEAGLFALSRWRRAEALLPSAYLTMGLDRVAHLSQGIAGPHATDGTLLSVGICAGWLVLITAAAGFALDRRDVLA